MQKDPVVSKASELLRLGLMPSPAELRAGKVSLLNKEGYIPLTVAAGHSVRRYPDSQLESESSELRCATDRRD